MKSIFILAVSIFLFNICAYSVEKPKPVKTDIKEVSVFLSGAQVMRTGSTLLSPGTTQVIIENLPSNLNQQSIQVTGKGEFTILSVQFQLNYLNAQKISKEVKSLKDSIEILRDQLSNEKAMQQVYSEEESMIVSNKSVGGQNTGVRIIDLKDGAEYFRLRLTDIKLKQVVIAKKVVKLNDEISRLNNHINLLNSRENRPTGEVVVTVSAKAQANAAFQLSYLVNDAGWLPVYDLRAVDVNNPVELAYKANVWQTTGEDWEKVALKINTGNPTVSGSRKMPSPWFLYFQYAESKKKRAKGFASAASESMVMKSAEMEMEVREEGAEYSKNDKLASSISDQTEMNENQTSVEFVIDVPYTIMSDGKQQVVEVQKFSIPASYEYYCAPKLDKDAFLIAHITGWEAYNLIPGDMNLFFEGTYVGKSYIDTDNTKDTLDISLGRDKNIVVSRTKMKDFSKKNFIGSNKVETRGFEIEVRNKKKQSLKILVEDQFPLSTNKEIEVEHLEKSEAKLNSETGILTWQFELKPSESKKMKMQYSVKYPKHNTVVLE